MARLVPLVLCATFLAARPAHAEPTDVDRELTAASTRLEALVEQHNAARADLAATRARVVGTTTRIAEVSSGLDAARDRVSQVASWAYKNGPGTGMEAVLAAGSPESFISRLATIEDLARVDQREIRQLTDSNRTLADDHASLSRLEQRQARQEAELDALTAQVGKDIAALTVLKTRIGAVSRQAPPAQAPPAQAPPAQAPPAQAPPAQAPPPPAPATVDAPAQASAPPPAASGAADRAVAFAYAQKGKPYRWGAAGPRSYDCSGLTSAAWQAAGISLPHNAARQYRAVGHVSRGQLRPGDLVFYYRDIHHVAMYVGNDSVIHAPTEGDHVRVQRMDYAPIQGFGRPA